MMLSVQKFKEIIRNKISPMKSQVIQPHLRFLEQTISKFKTQNLLSLSDSINLIHGLKNNFNHIKGKTEMILKNKLDYVVNKNIGLEVFKNTNKILNSDTSIVLESTK